MIQNWRNIMLVILSLGLALSFILHYNVKKENDNNLQEYAGHLHSRVIMVKEAIEALIEQPKNAVTNEHYVKLLERAGYELKTVSEAGFYVHKELKGAIAGTFPFHVQGVLNGGLINGKHAYDGVWQDGEIQLELIFLLEALYEDVFEAHNLLNSEEVTVEEINKVYDILRYDGGEKYRTLYKRYLKNKEE
ncbi:hypothetical protein DS745_03720 [Anaerobacillus alkaliphilus]|uniref:Uncharacterized protein n=1 Tax=Anaerobacillus alkaliphilus TaxID=1548597 RepID=A0A4Q0VYN5_9BACI|nr:hypothetical protein [Anaerobacillus alkaliphilus]RXJ04502.1 hypothetical protein DS745_03720 [Anaerobacillus alkaliphilus]